MDGDTAKAVAEALNAGETDKVIDGIRKFIAAHDIAIRENGLMENPTLPGGSTEKVVTREDFRKMSLSEMQKFSETHPELYQEYTR